MTHECDYKFPRKIISFGNVNGGCVFLISFYVAFALWKQNNKTGEAELERKKEWKQTFVVREFMENFVRQLKTQSAFGWKAKVARRK